MQNDYKRLILSVVIVLLAGLFAFGQETKVRFKDVLLDGKPAKLNVLTGEITLVDSNETRVITIKDSLKLVEQRGELLQDNVKNTDFHVVNGNETLLDIANRYNTTLTKLKEVNNLESTLVNDGQRLKIRNFDTTVEENPITESIEIEEKESFQTSKNAVEIEFHTVLEGETLYSLSNWYGTTVNELKTQNGLNSNLIRVNQILRVSNFNTSKATDDLDYWVVSKGDTLYNISKRNGISVEGLKRLNGLTTNLIKIGQKLKLK
ncbi:MAG: LysM peptidoglycan-binding domain-containing protein [Winogradskyella sp.]|uniref:LysM peptidoglycan-binding domain-containing protein n=1 Tax=Winogradskyella sp. TaxID=1883156 RepID=UPI0025D62E5F|nr:LysM peptidoglycan-binding domain-containing protein [Winogradskyella sp.]NRB82638.1 LysM peptidoglycan-binding domain-containing protein [Winogradskyella sp.]